MWWCFQWNNSETTKEQPICTRPIAAKKAMSLKTGQSNGVTTKFASGLFAQDAHARASSYLYCNN